METVWLFYCELVDFDEARLDVLELSFQNSSDIFQYAFEVQQKCLCDVILRMCDRVSCPCLTSNGLLAVGYIIKTSSQPVTSLKIYSHAHDSEIMILLQQLQEADLSKLKTLRLRDLKYDEESELLYEVFKKSNKVSHLALHLKISDLHVVSKLMEQ